MEGEKDHDKDITVNGFAPEGSDEEVGVVNKSSPLKQDLKGRHMQVIAIGKAKPDVDYA
jgi:amino acid permease